MTDILRVIPDELRGAATGWNAEVSGLHAAPPPLQPPCPWSTMLASTALTGAAQAATADLHTRVTTTAGATQVSAASYDAADSDAADMVKNVISTITHTVRENT